MVVLDIPDLNDMVTEAINEDAMRPEEKWIVTGYRRGLNNRQDEKIFWAFVEHLIKACYEYVEETNTIALY